MGKTFRKSDPNSRFATAKAEKQKNRKIDKQLRKAERIENEKVVRPG